MTKFMPAHRDQPFLLPPHDPPPDDDGTPPNDGSCRLGRGHRVQLPLDRSGPLVRGSALARAPMEVGQDRGSERRQRGVPLLRRQQLRGFVNVLPRRRRRVGVCAGLTDLPVHLQVWPPELGKATGFGVPDGGVLRPQNGGRLAWCGRRGCSNGWLSSDSSWSRS